MALPQSFDPIVIENTAPPAPLIPAPKRKVICVTQFTFDLLAEWGEGCVNTGLNKLITEKMDREIAQVPPRREQRINSVPISKIKEAVEKMKPFTYPLTERNMGRAEILYPGINWPVFLSEVEAEARIGDESSTDALKIISFCRDLMVERRELQRQVLALAERVSLQSELLSRKAEK